MNLDDYRTLFIVVTLGLALIAASPAIALVVSFEGSSEQFSEFWLLDSNHAVEDYPFNVSVGEMYSVFVAAGNHMGSPEYYKVYVKFGNSTQLDFNSSKPSSLPPLYEMQGFAGDGESWESLVTFGFQDVSIVDNATNYTPRDDVLSVNEVTINEIAFPVDVHTGWDAENGGFDFRLSFELWHYDSESKSFIFHNCIVGLPLNMTAS